MTMQYDLRIFYSGNAYVSGMCSRWDVQNYNLICETWLKKDAFNKLNDNIRPGACKELYKILGRPRYTDISWQAKNTIRFKPVAYHQSQLNRMRRETVAYPKSITSSVLPGSSSWLNVKLECAISGTQL